MLTGLDFSQPKRYTEIFKDKMNTYTVIQSGSGMQIQRTENQ